MARERQPESDLPPKEELIPAVGAEDDTREANGESEENGDG